MTNSVINLSTITHPQIQQIIDIIKSHNQHIYNNTLFIPTTSLYSLTNKTLLYLPGNKVWCLGDSIKPTQTPSEFIHQFTKHKLNFKL